MDAHYVAILKYLELHGIGKFINISPKLSELFKTPDRFNQDENILQLRAIASVLNNMKDNQLINLSPEPYGQIGTGKGETGYKWLEVPINASITIHGTDVLISKQNQQSAEFLNQSGISTNESIVELNDKTKKNYITQRNLTYAIMFAAVVSACAASAPFFTNQKKDVQDLQDTLKSVQLKLQQLQQNSQSQLKTDSSLQKVVKDSFTKS